MKHLFTCVLLLVILTACGGGSSPARPGCSKGGEVCIEVRAAEPIRFDEPVTVTITVTPNKDITKLGVSLYFDAPDVVVEEPQGGEKDGSVWTDQRGVDWIVDAKAGQPITFVRKVRFPSREGFFNVIVSASTPGFRAVNSIDIHLTREGGKIYLAGTSIPYTPGPLPTVTPGPSPTFIPTPASVLSPLATPTQPMQLLSPLPTHTGAVSP